MPGRLELDLHRPLPDHASIRSCTFTKQGRIWRVALQIEVADVHTVRCEARNLIGIGWKSANVSISLSASNSALGRHSGFLTMGDNNYYCPSSSSCLGLPDQGGAGIATLSELVEPGWVIGVARGMIPWFGAVKLWLEGNAAMVPPQSWEWMGLTIAGIILLAFGIHYALRAEGIEDPRRRAEEAEAELEEGPEEEPPHRAARFLRALQPWRRSAEEDEEDEIDGPPPKSRGSNSGSRLFSRRGRPPPRVKRGEKPKRSSDRDDEDL